MSSKATSKQAFLYLQASIVGTLLNFIARFPLAELVGFEASVILATYLGMVVVFLLSYQRAFAIAKPSLLMLARFVLVAHVGLLVVWLGSSISHASLNFFWPALFQTQTSHTLLQTWLPSLSSWAWLVPRLAEGFCHGLGIIAGFFVNFLGHKLYSFAPETAHEGQGLANLAAILIPISYLILYGPYAIDTTDFGFFYGYPWRILQGEIPYRDFYYTKPPVSLYWHSFWLWLSPERLSILLGKLGFLIQMLASAWLGALILKARCQSLLNIPLPLLATLGFVFGVHAFPAMPWHTADGLLFATACLYAAQRGWSIAAGILAVLALLTKQSFLGVPLASLTLLYLYSTPKKLYISLGTSLLTLLIFSLTLHQVNAWSQFLAQTTGGLSTLEALEAGLFIYIQQNWYIPFSALLLTILAHFLSLKFSQLKHRIYFFPTYTIIFTIAYIYLAITTPEWIGYGTSWPTFYLLLGVLYTSYHTLKAWYHKENYSAWLTVLILLAVAWSTGISGGYKTPAFFALPLLFTALLIHQAFGGKAQTLAWLSLVCGLLMFRIGYETPYTFPSRPMPRSSLIYDAGQVFPRLSGVQVDAESLGILKDLKFLRTKYGANYKTLPGFPLAYLLTNDRPALSAEWLQDWEINYEVDKVYQELLDKDIVVFFEKSQLTTLSPDKYARTRYTVPQKVQANWRQVDETEYFVVYKRQ